MRAVLGIFELIEAVAFVAASIFLCLALALKPADRDVEERALMRSLSSPSEE
jgi:DMSO/TMAO reductase YedYZ heme-binding membrane subunit